MSRETGSIEYVSGDATRPQGGGNKVIAHVCNDMGFWGRGFVLSLSARWKRPEQDYKECKKVWPEHFVLGRTQLVKVERDIWVANMIAQHGIRRDPSDPPPIRYDALRQCLSNLSDRVLKMEASVHMPRIGCGLAGGKWDRVEPILLDSLCAQGIRVFVYDPHGTILR